MSVKDFMKEILFDKLNIKTRWLSDKSDNSICGYGLSIRTDSLQYLYKLIDFMKIIKFRNVLYHNITVNDIVLSGHTGSGGQYLFFNIQKKYLHVVLQVVNQMLKICLNKLLTTNLKI